MQPDALMEQLWIARRIADHADRLGVLHSRLPIREPSHHLGAVLADAVLQAGVNYQTVVRARVARIETKFPETAILSGVLAVINRGGAEDFLLWNHPTKVIRFTSVANFLAVQCVETTIELRQWLELTSSREDLLSLNGIGPKTYDYLCCLVGIDYIAVDRHIKAFAADAGVLVTSYDQLKLAVSYAADLLGLRRREFDAWIWKTVSTSIRRVQSQTVDADGIS